MKPWVRYFVLALILAALALSARFWLPLLDFVGTNTDLIQGLGAVVQILIWIGFAVSTFLGFRHKPKPQPPTQHTNTSGGALVQGNVITGGGDFVGRDHRLDVNIGGGAYVGGDVSTKGGGFVGRDQTVIAGDGKVVGDFSATIHVQRDLVIKAAERYSRWLPSDVSPTELRKATEKYLQCLLDRHRYLKLKGMGVRRPHRPAPVAPGPLRAPQGEAGIA